MQWRVGDVCRGDRLRPGEWIALEQRDIDPVARVVYVRRAIALSGGAAVALADSAPIGPLPPGPVASITAERGELVAVALLQRSGGRVWRVARPINVNDLHQLSEANVGALS